MGWEAWVLGIDAAAFALSYMLYQHASQKSAMFKDAVPLEIDKDLKPMLKETSGQTIPYACISGRVEPQQFNQVLQSRYVVGKTGVIQILQTLEHRVRRIQGFWSDVSRVVSETVDEVPFQLSGSDDVSVQVEKAMTSSYLDDSLKIVHSHFEADKSSLLERGMDRIFGDVPKGIEKMEKMLEVGVQALGVGRIVMNGNRIQLVPPVNGKDYILTTLSKTELLELMESNARLLKGFLVLLGSVGVGVLLYCFYQKFKVWKEDYDARRAMEEFRTMRQQQGEDEGQDRDEEDQGRNCIICLSAPRQVVLLNCGHICLCAACVETLPAPRQCPVCRNRVERMLPVYMP